MRCQAITNDFRRCECFVYGNYFCYIQQKCEGLFIPSQNGLFFAKEQRQADVLQYYAMAILATGHKTQCPNSVVDEGHLHYRKNSDRESAVNAQLEFLFRHVDPRVCN
jgi:hypothetical protein